MSRRRSVLIAGVVGLVALVAGVPAAPSLAEIVNGPIHRLDAGGDRYQVAVSGNGRFVVTSMIGGFPHRLIDRTLNTTRPVDLGEYANVRVVSDDGGSIWFASDRGLPEVDPDGGEIDVYRFDVASSVVTLVTGGLDTTWAWSYDVADVSTDGTILALNGISSPLAAQGVFRFDTVSGELTRVDDTLPRVPGVNTQAIASSMSGDGRRLAYLVIGAGICTHVYVWDHVTSTNQIVDVTESGAPGSECMDEAEIADDGRHVVYSESPFFVQSAQVRVRLLESNETWIVGEGGYDLSISADGQRTAFLTGDQNSGQLWVHDHAQPPGAPLEDVTQVVSGPFPGLGNGGVWTGQITGDGASVVFSSSAPNLDGPSSQDLRVYERDLSAPPPPSVPPPSSVPPPATVPPPGSVPPPPGNVPPPGSVPLPENVPSAGYVSVSPVRLMDTRVGASTVDGLFAGIGRRGGGETLRLGVVGRAGVPAGVGAVVLNVTVTDPEGAGFVTLWPCDGSGPPTASHLNFVAGLTVPNLVVVPVSASGEVCVYTADSATHLIADLNGWFPASPGYVSVSPVRLMDTRVGASTVDGLFAGIGRRGGGETLRLGVVGRAGVPAGVGAVVLNVTVTDPEGAGFVTLWPCDGSGPPTASHLNFVAGLTVPNLVVVPVSASGEVCVYTADSATHLIADLNGWFPASPGYVSVSPVRLMDTRVGASTVDGLFAGIGHRGGGETLRLGVVGRAGVPAGVGAVVLNVTVTDPEGAGFVTLWPCDGSGPPTASHLNFVAGLTVPNLVVVPVSSSGEVCVYTADSATHLIADLNGWFPPTA